MGNINLEYIPIWLWLRILLMAILKMAMLPTMVMILLSDNWQKFRYRNNRIFTWYQTRRHGHSIVCTMVSRSSATLVTRVILVCIPLTTASTERTHGLYWYRISFTCDTTIDIIAAYTCMNCRNDSCLSTSTPGSWPMRRLKSVATSTGHKFNTIDFLGPPFANMD